MRKSKDIFLMLVAIFLGGLILGLSLYNLNISPTITGRIVTKNPDFYPTMRKAGFQSTEYNHQPPLYGWADLNYFYDGTPPDPTVKGGIILVHPWTPQMPTYVYQVVELEQGKNYVLKARVANLARYYGPTDCADSIVIIRLIDMYTREEMVVFNEVLNTNDEWKTISADVSNFAGRTVLLQGEGHAGGPCGDWYGEWSAIDYLYIEEV